MPAPGLAGASTAPRDTKRCAWTCVPVEETGRSENSAALRLQKSRPTSPQRGCSGVF